MACLEIESGRRGFGRATLHIKQEAKQPCLSRNRECGQADVKNSPTRLVLSANGAGIINTTAVITQRNAVTAHIVSDSTVQYSAVNKGERKKKTGYSQTKDGPGLLAAPRSLHQYP